LADYKSKPKRALWAAVGFSLSAIVLCVILVLQGILSNELSIDEKSRENIKNILKSLKI